MVVRCTAKVLKLLGLRPAALERIDPTDDDWYLNLFWLDSRKCLLLTHAGTAFSVFVPDVRKRDLEPLGPFLTSAIVQALDAEQLPHDVLGPLDPTGVKVAKTASKRVLGWMTELTFQISYQIPPGELMDVDTISLNRHLQRIPHLTDGGFFTIDRVRDRAGLERERPLWR